MNVRITVTADTATPAVRQLVDALTNQVPILTAMGHRLVRDTSRHVSEWGLGHPNKLGGRRTNFWTGIAAKINPGECLDVDAHGATMSIGGPDMPGLSRAFGDVTIKPGTKTPGAKYIPIPARAEAYGMRPREMNNLVVFWGKNGPAGLKEVDHQAVTVVGDYKKKKGQSVSGYTKAGAVSGGLVMFWFATEVHQPQDRTILPSEEAWSQSANDAAGEWLDAEIKKGGRA